FNLHLITILPALVIFLLAALRKKVQVTMFSSILTAIFVCRYFQNFSFQQIFNYMIFGYMNTDPELTGIISGGGLMSMVSVTFVVLIASSYSGIFEGTGMLNDIQGALVKISKKTGVYITTVFTGVITCAFCCNQTLPILLTQDLMKNIYKKNGLTKSHLALDIENTVILIAELFPWSIAIAVPLATIDVGARAIPYAVFLYLVPLLAPLTPKFIKKTMNLSLSK
ncbi:MAG TPA: Na+/H+ antiporter NhaC family protein, partial [Sedimentibacter sp.]|nr:Na+/H+ antiporter NhaC family protein [Sedimentibacter sp.]